MANSNSRQFRSWYIPEPELLFGSNQRSVDPKTGISLYGPYYFGGQGHSTPSEIRLGIIGDGETVGLTKNWLDRCRSGIRSTKDNVQLFPSFDGLNKDRTFRTEFIIVESLIEKITSIEISRITEIPHSNERIFKACDLYAGKIKILSQREQPPDVIICCLPKDIEEYCGISIKTRGAKRPKYSEMEKKVMNFISSGQKFLSDFDIGPPPLATEKAYDLRRALKGRAMPFGIPIQILRYKTLLGDKGIEDEATRTWNFALGLYYKAGGFPWRLADFDPNTCYVGISFYKDLKNPSAELRTSVAQVFTSYGDGLVLRGNPVQIDKHDRTPHLSDEAAFDLLDKAINLYIAHTKHGPSRVVIHKTSRFNEEELRGFNRASARANEVVLVAFGERNIKFFRPGMYPPLRGTFIQLPDDSYILYSIGYMPYLKTYPGMRVPQPLEILEIIGDYDPTKIAEEILSLTKMNWNSSRFAIKDPITIAFSQEVGKILSEIPEGVPIQEQYRYYM